MKRILAGLETCTGVRGRCEVIPTGRDFTVICDYAHTPDAIENILRSVKEYTRGRLICLFGCGGNRDATKRPKMAAAAAKYADFLMITPFRGASFVALYAFTQSKPAYFGD